MGQESFVAQRLKARIAAEAGPDTVVALLGAGALFGLARVSSVVEGIKEAGVNVGDLGMFEELMDARSLYLTANSTTISRGAGCVG